MKTSAAKLLSMFIFALLLLSVFAATGAETQDVTAENGPALAIDCDHTVHTPRFAAEAATSDGFRACAVADTGYCGQNHTEESQFFMTLENGSDLTDFAVNNQNTDGNDYIISDEIYMVVDGTLDGENQALAEVESQAFAPENNGGAQAGVSSGIKIELCYGKARFNYTDNYITPDNHLIAGELFFKKINGTYAQKIQIMSKCLAAGGTYKNAVLYTMPLFEGVVDRAIKSINRAPVDSKMSFEPDERPMFKIKREAAGIRVNEERLYQKIHTALRVRPQVKIDIDADSVAPRVTAEDNIKLTQLRTKYSTGYARSNENRKDNIKLALSKVNGTVLNENQLFSFNKTVGRRTAANGFKESTIIVGGKYEKGTGGGVCQASTTLYNAALLAGLKVTSARNHSLECSYELPSFDAMVNDGSSDLKFKNTEKTPVFLRCYGTDTSAVIEIYGSAMDYEIRRQSEVIYRKEPPGSETVVDKDYKYHAPDAESGASKVVNYPHGEMKSVGFLLYYGKDGCFIKKEKIREDVYSAVKGLVAVAP